MGSGNNLQNKYDILNNVPMGICIIDKNYIARMWNNCLVHWTNIKSDAVIGKDIRDFFPDLNKPKFDIRIQNVFTGGPPAIFSSQIHTFVIPSFHFNGAPRVQQTIVTAVESENEGEFYAMFTAQDVSDISQQYKKVKQLKDKALEEVDRRVIAEAKLVELAIRDGLTGIFNRRHLIERLEETLNSAKRHSYSVCFALFDLDHFKKINDTYGHQAGDDVIVRFCKTLESEVRNEDIVARYGGEEFVVVFPYLKISEAENCLERILTKFKENVFKSTKGKQFQVTASCGIAEYDLKESLEMLIYRADNALYEAKENGRDQFRIATK